MLLFIGVTFEVKNAIYTREDPHLVFKPDKRGEYTFAEHPGGFYSQLLAYLFRLKFTSITQQTWSI